jgi:hypothetical protein
MKSRSVIKMEYQVLLATKINIIMKSVYTLILLTIICICCKNNDKRNKESSHWNSKFEGNASIDDIHKDVKEIAIESDFCVIFCIRDNINHGWYKIFSLKGDNWEKIDIQQNVMDEEQMRKEPGYYITRDITTKKLCKLEEANSFLSKLMSYGLFELPEEKMLFKKCKDSGITDIGSTYIDIVSENKVRSLKYSGAYECPDGQRKNIYKIQELFENEWF